ncbi:nuclear transport factor 2 family protein [Demequina sediminicola]|uniref:nuclear transport factor 2 family protein n=1 Tax=Demequina sediminicola TaxID=1095026 RepID=UPI000784CE13|nr:nuclear transport factor 2 family protein [Demequina sediminicola]
MMELAHDEALTLQAMEEALWRPETRFDRRYMDAVLADNFYEVGLSGRTYSREDTLELPPLDIDITFPLVGFQALAICDDVALVTYTSMPARGRGVALRSSVWVNDGRWRLRYHQATPTEV